MIRYVMTHGGTGNGFSSVSWLIHTRATLHLKQFSGSIHLQYFFRLFSCIAYLLPHFLVFPSRTYTMQRPIVDLYILEAAIET